MKILILDPYEFDSTSSEESLIMNSSVIILSFIKPHLNLKRTISHILK
ncbi:MAG: hypothetical protein GY760_00530 [Deltaproteobacteria bacterium]|nr:hypothetical protein [Deltaproteobacteria bacterium]